MIKMEAYLNKMDIIKMMNMDYKMNMTKMDYKMNMVANLNMTKMEADLNMTKMEANLNMTFNIFKNKLRIQLMFCMNKTMWVTSKRSASLRINKSNK